MILGICGQINTGKDTVADILCGEYGFLRVSFADHLKMFCLQMFPDILSTEILWGPSNNRTPKVRKLLQYLGTDIARGFDPNVWTKHTLNRIQQVQKTGIDPLARIADTRPGRNVIIPDIRFKNEAQALLKLDAHLIKVTRPDNYKLVSTTTSARGHISETGIDDIPLDLFFTQINNDGTREDLSPKVHRVLNAIRLLKS